MRSITQHVDKVVALTVHIQPLFLKLKKKKEYKMLESSHKNVKKKLSDTSYITHEMNIPQPLEILWIKEVSLSIKRCYTVMFRLMLFMEACPFLLCDCYSMSWKRAGRCIFCFLIMFSQQRKRRLDTKNFRYYLFKSSRLKGSHIYTFKLTGLMQYYYICEVSRRSCL